MQEDENNVITIDGPAASGKSSVSSRISDKIGYLHVNSGLMYRAFTWSVLRSGIDLNDLDSVVGHLNSISINCGQSDGISTLTIDGLDPGIELKASEINENVSLIAAIEEVRTVLVSKQRDYLKIANIVMEGRDIGSVVFPETPYKFYIDASAEVRAKRRMAEGESDDLEKRDKIDTFRKISPLLIPDDACVIDTSEMDFEQVVLKVLNELKARGLATV
ncbi:MAG: (d)CMP kinase [Verrucomicrobiales bacterium]|nr:(d)CMP kinase [Verrucomicrobiales bacterium]